MCTYVLEASLCEKDLDKSRQQDLDKSRQIDLRDGP